MLPLTVRLRVTEGVAPPPVLSGAEYLYAEPAVIVGFAAVLADAFLDVANVEFERGTFHRSIDCPAGVRLEVDDGSFL